VVRGSQSRHPRRSAPIEPTIRVVAFLSGHFEQFVNESRRFQLVQGFDVFTKAILGQLLHRIFVELVFIGEADNQVALFVTALPAIEVPSEGENQFVFFIKQSFRQQYQVFCETRHDAMKPNKIGQNKSLNLARLPIPPRGHQATLQCETGLAGASQFPFQNCADGPDQHQFDRLTCP
jgi:hypothetical protein